MEEEKRRHERFAISQTLELTDRNKNKYTVRGINLSESGILCRHEKAIEPGSIVSFSLAIPAGHSTITVSCEGLILRCTENNGQFDVIIELNNESCDD